jgi:predicted nucleic acid-binding protein
LIEFFDTSVLIAAGQTTHVHHKQSFERLAAAKKARCLCSPHLSGSLRCDDGDSAQAAHPAGRDFDFHSSSPCPPPPITLLNAVQDTAERGLTSGKIYDALLLACAAKSNAQVIYTWNLKHFRAIAPHLAERLQNP